MDTNTDGTAADLVAAGPDLAAVAREFAALMRLTCPGTHLPPVPAGLYDLHVPARLPSDPPWTPGEDHPFEFLPLAYDQHGQPIPTPAGTWRYTSRTAALHGHRLIVGALRAGYAARRPPARIRPRPHPGPWRRGYHRRGAW